MVSMHTRRRFLAGLSLAGAAGLVRAPPLLAADGAIETTTVRIAKIGAICLAPQYVSEELLRAEALPIFAMSMCQIRQRDGLDAARSTSALALPLRC